MQASFLKKFEAGAHVFKRGDAVDHFYVITRGQCDVLVPAKSQEAAADSGGGGGGSSSSSKKGATRGRPVLRQGARAIGSWVTRGELMLEPAQPPCTLCFRPLRRCCLLCCRGRGLCVLGAPLVH